MHSISPTLLHIYWWYSVGLYTELRRRVTYKKNNSKCHGLFSYFPWQHLVIVDLEIVITQTLFQIYCWYLVGLSRGWEDMSRKEQQLQVPLSLSYLSSQYMVIEHADSDNTNTVSDILMRLGRIVHVISPDSIRFKETFWSWQLQHSFRYINDSY